MSTAARKARKRAGERFLHQPSGAKRVPYRSTRYVRGADPLALPDLEPLLPLGVLPAFRGYTR